MRGVLAKSLKLDSGMLTGSAGNVPCQRGVRNKLARDAGGYGLNRVLSWIGPPEGRKFCSHAREEISCRRVAVFLPAARASRWRVQASNRRPRKCAD